MYINELKDFLNSKDRNKWIHFPRIKVYVRKANRYSRFKSPKIIETFDIASVEVDQDYRGTGIFTEFLGAAELVAEEYNRKVFVESILEDRLKDFLKKRGYINAGPNEIHNLIQP